MTDPVRGPIGRALRNAGWLLGGKGVGGLFSLVYLALAARSLGVAQFGIFTLVLTYGTATTNLVQFQSWQTVIRYGAGHLAAGRVDPLRRVVAFTACLDLGAAATGALAAALCAPLVGMLLGWTGAEARVAALFSATLVFGLRGTPTGILRLFDRFDLAAYSETALPAMRLVGAIVVVVAGASVAGFLAAWALAELVTTIVMWRVAARELSRRGLGGIAHPPLGGVVAENPQLWRFAWTTNLTTSINAVWSQLPTLAVGGAAGAATAGGYRLAVQLTAALSKPATSLARSVYPEFARLAVDGGPRAMAPVVTRAARLAAAGGLAVVLLIVVAGRPALHLIGGEAYVFAYPYLLVLAIASAIDLCGFGLEPALVALGRSGTILALRLVGAGVYVGLIALLLDRFGAIGASYAAVAASALMLAMLTLRWRRALTER